MNKKTLIIKDPFVAGNRLLIALWIAAYRQMNDWVKPLSKKRLLFLGIFLALQVLQSIAQSPQVLKTRLLKSKPDTSHVNLLLQLGDLYLLTGNKAPVAMDSALTYAYQAITLSQSLHYLRGAGNSYLLLAKIYGEKEAFKKGKPFAQKAVLYFSKYGPKNKLTDSYVALADNLEWEGSGLTEKIRLLAFATGIYHNEEDIENEATALKKWGKVMMFGGEQEKSMEKLKQSLVLYQSINYVRIQEVYSLIGLNYLIRGNNSEALKYGLLAVKTAEELKDSSNATAVIYDYLGVTYDKLGELERTDEYFKKGLAIAKRGTDTVLIYTLVTNIAQGLLRQNKLHDAITYLKDLAKNYPSQKSPMAIVEINAMFLKAYMRLKEYKNGEIYCEKLIAIADKSEPNDQNLIILFPAICQYLLETHQYNRAHIYLAKYKALYEKNKFCFEQGNIHKMWFKVDSAQGNYVSAIKHYQLYKTISDSLYNESKSKQIAELQIQYDTEKKDKDIQLLTERDLLQKTELKQSEFLRNVILGGVVLLVIILLLLYNRYRMKLRSNQKLEAQQKEIYEKNKWLQHLLEEKDWLVKEIHHRVKNNLQTVISLLNSQYVYLQNEEAQSAIQDSHNRILAMSLIHQKLYISDNLSTINMPVYIRELVANLRDCYDTKQRIRFELKIEELELDVSQAVPLGLILNEAITNAIKYAFPNNRNGVITITLLHTVNDHFLLTVADNGIGMPSTFNNEKPGSLGMSLMEGLSEDLDGTFSIENNNGTVLKISFVHDVSIKRIATFTLSPTINNS